jgi:hypothetical protein
MITGSLVGARVAVKAATAEADLQVIVSVAQLNDELFAI